MSRSFFFLLQLLAVATDRLLQAEIERVANQGMADGDLVEPGDLLVEVGQVL